MSYEVYIDVRHHPRHNEDAERRIETAFRLADVDGSLTRAFDNGNDSQIKRVVADLLRGWADELAAEVRKVTVEERIPIRADERVPLGMALIGYDAEGNLVAAINIDKTRLSGG